MIINPRGFRLPFLGTDAFKELMKLGLSYEQGQFSVKNLNNLEAIRNLLTNILDEEIIFTQICIICEKDFLCQECKHCNDCYSRNLPLFCICNSCSQKNDLYELYVAKNNKKMKKSLMLWGVDVQ